SLESLDQVGEAVLARMNALSTNRQGGKAGIQTRHGAAIIDPRGARSDGLSQDNPEYRNDDQALITAAARESRLQGGSLVAAGGWCAPGETLYGLCSIESTDGILDLPSVGITRSGIRYTKGPSFQDLYTDPNLGWDLTNAEVIAEETKPSVTVACPDFEEITLRAVGLSARAGLLTVAAYPDL